jgi:rhodanese-related sulfurtransferase
MKFIHKFKYLIILFAFVALSACAVSEDFTSMENSGNLITSDSLIHDWGDINIQGGDVSHVFQFSNDSEESLYLKGAATSCMCTTAIYRLPDGSASPVFGMHNNPVDWSAEIEPGVSFEVEATFDPMAHGPDAIGVIQRSVTLATSDSDQPNLELKVGGEVLYEEDFNDRNASPVAQSSSEPFQVLQASELQTMLNDKDFFLVDVHIPEQEHIPGTDAFIDYREIAENLDQLPEDKDAKIVVYCRSGSMSREAVNDLAELGYTNLYDLEGGINAFNAL